MSTRSVVALPMDGGFRGRYVHSDGYPEWVGRALWALIQRDGIDTVIDTVIRDHNGWSSLNPNVDPNKDHGLDDRAVVVPGYGVAYTEAQGQSSPEDWIWSNADDWGTEYAYVIGTTAITVLERGDTWKVLGTYPLGADEPDWAAIA